MATDLKLTTESVKTSILQEELLRKGTSTSTALQVRIQKKSIKGQKGQNKGKRGENKGEKDKGGNGKQCGYAACGLKGHTEDECCKLKAFLDKHGHLKQKDSKPSTSTITANTATTTIAPVNDYADAIHLFIARGEMRENPNDWVVDSGATEHMCSSWESFVSYRPLTIHKKVCLGNGTIIYAPGIGNVSLEFNLGNTTQQGLVQNIYYVPELHSNLFSLSNLTKRRYKTVFNENACRIYNPEGTLTAVAHLHGNMFILDTRTSAPTIRVTTLLHNDERMTSLDAPASAYAARTKTLMILTPNRLWNISKVCFNAR
jgi:hypothetical protein